MTNGLIAHWSLVDAYVRVITQSPTPLVGDCCDALLHYCLPTSQFIKKLNHVSSVQSRRSVCTGPNSTAANDCRFVV